MLKDRRILMEKEMIAYKQMCGHLYLEIVMGTAEPNDRASYASKREHLGTMIADIAIVDQMIADGHE